MNIRKVTQSEIDEQATKTGPPPAGLVCPRCGCQDFRNARGPVIRKHPWRTLRTQKLKDKIRRYKVCRYCGRRIRTVEAIEE